MSSIPTVLVRIFASSPPSIAIALGFVLVFFGYTMNNGGMISAGWNFVLIGFVLQVFWLLLLHGRK